MKRRKLLVGFALLLLLAGVSLLLSIYARADSRPDIATAAVVKKDIEKTVLATGTLYAIKTVEVGAQVSGQLEHLHVSLGQHVEKGELLAQIDPVLQQNSLKEAEAELENIDAEIAAKNALLKQYSQNYARQKQLFSADAGPRADFENAEAEYFTTQAEIRSLQAQLKKAAVAVDTAKANLGYTRITAPMSGTVVEIAAEEGQTLVSSQSVSTILTLADLERMTVKAQISEADVDKVKAGQKVSFTTLGNTQKSYAGTLRAIEPSPVEDSSSSSSAVYYNGLFDIDNPQQSLRIGMTAEVTIVVARSEQALVAPASVLRDNGHHFETMVEVLEQGRPVPRRVTVGLNDSLNVEITSGVQPGEQLVIHDTSLPQAEQTEAMRPPGPMGGPPPGRP